MSYVPVPKWTAEKCGELNLMIDAGATLKDLAAFAEVKKDVIYWLISQKKIKKPVGYKTFKLRDGMSSTAQRHRKLRLIKLLDSMEANNGEDAEEVHPA